MVIHWRKDENCSTLGWLPSSKPTCFLLINSNTMQPLFHLILILNVLYQHIFLILGSRVPMPATFTKLFMPITKIFCCDKMSKILTVVLFRASKSESKITPDTLIEEVGVHCFHRCKTEICLQCMIPTLQIITGLWFFQQWNICIVLLATLLSKALQCWCESFGTRCNLLL